MFNLIKLKNPQINEIVDKLSTNHNCNLEELKSYNFYLNEKNGKIHITKINVEEFENFKISGTGLYFGTIHDNDRFRLSIEGTQLISPKSNYIKINENTLKSYLAGENLFKHEITEINYENRCPFLIVIYDDENLGCINIKDDMAFNYVPKSRRLSFNKVF